MHSLLEYRYVRDVERPHGLPRADRQAKVTRRNGRGYLDNLYEEYQVCVELDGRAAHPDDRRWHDIHRDNAAAEEGRITLRYNWADITRRACPTAWQVGTVLQQTRLARPRPPVRPPLRSRVTSPRLPRLMRPRAEILETWVRYMPKSLQDH